MPKQPQWACSSVSHLAAKMPLPSDSFSSTEPHIGLEILTAMATLPCHTCKTTRSFHRTVCEIADIHESMAQHWWVLCAMVLLWRSLGTLARNKETLFFSLGIRLVEKPRLGSCRGFAVARGRSGPAERRSAEGKTDAHLPSAEASPSKAGREPD